MEVSEGIKMTSPSTFGRWEQVRQEHDIILRVSGIGSLVVDRGGQGTMTALAEVLTDDFVFVGGQESIEGLADKLQGIEIGVTAVAKYLNLDLDWQAPRGRRSRRIGIETVTRARRMS